MMYRPLRSFKQSVPYLVVDVQSCFLDHYTLYSVGNVHSKFKGFTVDVQAATKFLTISTIPFYKCTKLPLVLLHIT